MCILLTRFQECYLTESGDTEAVWSASSHGRPAQSEIPWCRYGSTLKHLPTTKTSANKSELIRGAVFERVFLIWQNQVFKLMPASLCIQEKHAIVCGGKSTHCKSTSMFGGSFNEVNEPSVPVHARLKRIRKTMRPERIHMCAFFATNLKSVKLTDTFTKVVPILMHTVCTSRIFSSCRYLTMSICMTTICFPSPSGTSKT